MKLCVDCQHLTKFGWCISPANGISLVTGTANRVFAENSRADFHIDNSCGQEARHFEQKQKTTWKFWKKKSTQ